MLTDDEIRALRATGWHDDATFLDCAAKALAAVSPLCDEVLRLRALLKDVPLAREDVVTDEVIRLRAELAELRAEVDAERRASEKERERDSLCPRHGGAHCDC